MAKERPNKTVTERRLARRRGDGIAKPIEVERQPIAHRVGWRSHQLVKKVMKMKTRKPARTIAPWRWVTLQTSDPWSAVQQAMTRDMPALGERAWLERIDKGSLELLIFAVYADGTPDTPLDLVKVLQRSPPRRLQALNEAWERQLEYTDSYESVLAAAELLGVSDRIPRVAKLHAEMQMLSKLLGDEVEKLRAAGVQAAEDEESDDDDEMDEDYEGR